MKLKTILVTVISILLVFSSLRAESKNEVSVLVSTSASLTFFKANHPNIQYTGRIDFNNPERPKLCTPGSYIEAKFTGTSCKIVVCDEVKWGKNHNYLEIVIDGTNPYRIQTAGKTDTISVAENLPDGEHTILICKDTEVNIGYLEFLGFICSDLIPMSAKPLRKMEFIGNSITCGTGSDASMVKCGQGVWQDQHNAYMAYGPIVARSLDAQWYLTSYSGIGLIHSCCDIKFSMPEVFGKLSLVPESPDWDFNRYVPDVVTICLGQNDGIQDSATFCSAYVKFVLQLRAYYPNAHIICLTSPMADARLTANMKNQLSGVENYFLKSGDLKVHKFFFSRSYNSGCDFHPDLKEHQLIANELEPFIRKIMAW